MSPLHSGFENIFKALREIWHLVFRSLICGMNDNFLSNITPRKRVSSLTGSCLSYRWSLCCFIHDIFLQKWTATVFVGENLNPFSFVHFSKMLSCCWSCLSMDSIFPLDL